MVGDGKLRGCEVVGTVETGENDSRVPGDERLEVGVVGERGGGVEGVGRGDSGGKDPGVEGTGSYEEGKNLGRSAYPHLRPIIPLTTPHILSSPQFHSTRLSCP